MRELINYVWLAVAFTNLGASALIIVAAYKLRNAINKFYDIMNGQDDDQP